MLARVERTSFSIVSDSGSESKRDLAFLNLGPGSNGAYYYC